MEFLFHKFKDILRYDAESNLKKNVYIFFTVEAAWNIIQIVRSEQYYTHHLILNSITYYLLIHKINH